MTKTVKEDEKWVNSIISVIKAEGLDPLDNIKVIKSLGQCVCAIKLITFYKNNKYRISELRYTYE